MELHQVSGEEAARQLDTDLQRGLSRAQVEKRRARWGKNEIQEERRRSLIARFFSQFQDVMVLILLAAAGASFAVSWLRGEGDYADPVIILAIVVCNAVIGTVQEWKADQAIAALKKLSSPHATVVREGRKQTVESSQLVPGDVVILQAGDLVPADIRLVKAVELRAEESALTGESVPVEKDAAARCREDAPLGERKNMVFAGTGITTGAGAGVVAAIGMDTAMGKIARMLSREKAPQTPLQQRLKQTGRVLGIGVTAICGVIFLLGLLQKTPPLEMFLIAISLGVAAIPEGLTAVVTIVLAMGVGRMAQKRAIVRHMPAVETLGSTGVICSDKTGTLTQNKMTVVAFSSARGAEPLDSPLARFSLELAALCSNAEEGGGGRSHRRPHRDGLPGRLPRLQRGAGAAVSPGGRDPLHLRPEADGHCPPDGAGIPHHRQGRAGCAFGPVHPPAPGRGGRTPQRRAESQAPRRQQPPGGAGPAGCWPWPTGTWTASPARTGRWRAAWCSAASSPWRTRPGPG